jgi:hypothetical protein
MEEAPENGNESSHSAHANGMNKLHTIAYDSLLAISQHLTFQWCTIFPTGKALTKQVAAIILAKVIQGN